MSRAAVAVGGLAAMLALGSCSKPAPKPPVRAFDTTLALSEVMAHVVQPAAMRFWGGTGTLYDKTGLHDLTPTTEEGWKTVEDGAAGVIEASNLLTIPARALPPQAEWYRHVDALNKIGKEALAAADRKDKAAMAEVGSRMDVVCDECHERFMPPEKRGEAPAPAAAKSPAR